MDRLKMIMLSQSPLTFPIHLERSERKMASMPKKQAFHQKKLSVELVDRQSDMTPNLAIQPQTSDYTRDISPFKSIRSDAYSKQS